MPTFSLARMALVSLALTCSIDPARAQTPAASDGANLRTAPLEPAEAVKSSITHDGFRMELLAAEPLLTDPVAMAYDEDGRAWVVEMNDYPYTDKSTDVPQQERTTDLPLGKLRVLEDVDGDGVFDRSHVLAEELSWPSGIALYDGGAFIAGTPDIWYVKDTDGDGRADVRHKVFSGFRKFNVQAVINNLAWGLDHKIYGAGASNGGQIETPETKNSKAVTMARNDFCFDPRDPQIEVLSGGARFGNTFDDFGNRFICNIRNPAQHVVLPARYLARNPYFRLSSALQDVADAGDAIPVYRRSPPEPWRVINADRLATAGNARTPRSEKAATGYMTSAAGVTVYRGNAYPAKYYGNLFLGEVSGNLIHREVPEAVGVTFRSTRGEQESEFVASTDNWFRPVNFVNAPDGTLHILDMYRETIEHPWSIPDDLKARLDLTSGRDRGRIYRLSPPGFKPPAPPRLSKATTEELARHLKNPNAWWRETAHRLLFERQDRGAIPMLMALMRKGESPVTRLHALWSLEGLGALNHHELQAALDDKSARVREHAILLAEPMLAKDASLLKRVLELADDADARVRFQAALSLGEVDDPRAAAALTSILRRDMRDPWTRAAVLSARPSLAGPLLVELMTDETFRRDESMGPLARDLAMIVGAARDEEDAKALVAQVESLSVDGPERWLRMSVVAGLGEGARKGRGTWKYWSEAKSPATRLVEQSLGTAKAVAIDPQSTLAQRQLAMSVLALASLDEVRPTFAQLLAPQQPQDVQIAAVRAIACFSKPEVADLLLAGWKGYTPALRGEVVEALLARTEYFDRLFAAIETGAVPPSSVSQTRQALLLKHSNESIRNRAAKLFKSEGKGVRQEVVARYQPALSLTGDAERGQKVYQRECAACHKWGALGHDVGPNLATILHRSPAELLVAILDPNREVGPNFVQYAAVLDDGRISTGLIASETPTSITLRRAENQQETVLRQNLEELTSTGMSLMPEGLEQKITPQEAADLFAFLRGGK